MRFRKQQREEPSEWDMMDSTEERLQQIVDLIKDLETKEFNKLMEAIKLIWQGYSKIRQVKTTEEKAGDDIKDDGLGVYIEEENGK